jgi:hypothetical protein
MMTAGRRWTRTTWSWQRRQQALVVLVVILQLAMIQKERRSRSPYAWWLKVSRKQPLVVQGLSVLDDWNE